MLISMADVSVAVSLGTVELIVKLKVLVNNSLAQMEAWQWPDTMAVAIASAPDAIQALDVRLSILAVMLAV